MAILQPPLATWSATCSGTICAELWLGKAMKSCFRGNRASSGQVQEKFSLPFKPLYWVWQSAKDDDTSHLEISVYTHASMWNSGCLWVRILFFSPPSALCNHLQQHCRTATLKARKDDPSNCNFWRTFDNQTKSDSFRFYFFSFLITNLSVCKSKFMHSDFL